MARPCCAASDAPTLYAVRERCLTPQLEDLCLCGGKSSSLTQAHKSKEIMMSHQAPVLLSQGTLQTVSFDKRPPALCEPIRLYKSKVHMAICKALCGSTVQ